MILSPQASIPSFSIVALEAAYREGEDWLNQAMAYIAANYDYMESFLADHIPQIKPFRPDGTYLIWLDCRALGMDHKALESFMQERVKVTFNEGYTFGDQGQGFERINIACPRSILERAHTRLKTELEKLDIQ